MAQAMGDQRSLLEDTVIVPDYDTFPQNAAEKKRRLSDISKVPVLTSCRWVTSYMCFTGMILVFAVRANLVMGLVCLLPRAQDGVIFWKPLYVDNKTDMLPLNQNTSKAQSAIWNDKTQGLALSAYYYGSIVSPIVGGYAATKSAKYVMVFTMTMSAVVTAVTPMAMTYDAYLTVILRIALGIFGGVYEPTMQHLMTSWSPKKERGKLTALTQSGKVVGNVLSFVLSGVLCSVGFLGGWPLTFYGTGALCLLWVFILLCLVYDGPECHPRITRCEREYIKAGVAQPKKKSGHTTVLSTPWLAMMTSLPFLACLLVKFAGAWVFNVQSSNQPMWLRDVLRFDVEKNGIFSALPYAGQFLGSLAAGVVLDLVSRTRLSATFISKSTFVICLSLPAGAIFSQSFMTEREKTLAVCLTVFCTTVYSAVPVALRLAIMELAPRYTGILMGIITTVGCIPGMVAPLVTSIITADGTEDEWAKIFYMCSGLYVGAALVYLIIGRAEEQPWGR